MTTGYYELDKLTFLQRQKYDHLFHVLYDTTNDKTVSRQDFLELLKKVQLLRRWPTGCPGYLQAERIIAKVWTAFQKGNRKYRNKESQMHLRDHEWRRYWGDFVEAARTARGWPENSLDEDVNYAWQKDYMIFMFDLMDVNGDGSLDRGEYIKCFTSFGLSVDDCNAAFDRFAVDSYGRPIDEIGLQRFEELWFQYLTSDDLHAHPGNFLMGKLDLQQHAPAGYPMDQMYITSSTNDVARKPKHEAPKVVGVKPSSVTMVYGQITGGAPHIGNLDEDQIYDPSKRRYQNDPGVDVGGTGRGPNRGGHNYAPRQPAPTRQFNQVPSGGEFGVQYSAKPQSAPPAARQDSAGRSLQIKVNSIANPSMASPPAATSMQDVGPVNYSSSGQINLRQQQQQQQQPHRHIQSAPSNTSATAPSIAAFNCTVEDAPVGFSRTRPGQQFAPVKSAATFNQPTYNQPQANLYNQPQANLYNQPQANLYNQPQSVSHGQQSNYSPQSSQSKYGAQILDNNPSPFAQTYGPEKSFKNGARPQVRGMPAKQPPQRKGAPFAVEPQRSGPPPPGGPRGGRPVYSDF